MKRELTLSNICKFFLKKKPLEFCISRNSKIPVKCPPFYKAIINSLFFKYSFLLTKWTFRAGFSQILNSLRFELKVSHDHLKSELFFWPTSHETCFSLFKIVLNSYFFYLLRLHLHYIGVIFFGFLDQNTVFIHKLMFCGDSNKSPYVYINPPNWYW